MAKTKKKKPARAPTGAQRLLRAGLSPRAAKKPARALAIPAPKLPSLPIAGETERFPVRRIYCVGRNYAEHSREMGHDPTRELPFFFTKDSFSLVAGDGVFPYPTLSQDVHHEIELVAAVGKGGADIPADKALRHIYGYAVGLDMTRRDLQGEAKKIGRPWEVGKAFDRAALCSKIRPATKSGHPTKGLVWLKINGAMKQKGDLSEMIWNIPEIVMHLSRLFPLAPGDLIFTGTPAGVGAVKKGDVLEGGVDGIATLKVRVG
jgi:fumarylpyruvate hydrolase